MTETSASFKIQQKYQKAISADVFSFSVKNVTCMGSVFLLALIQVFVFTVNCCELV